VVECRVKLDDGTVAVVKDYFDESDKIIDTEVRTKHGHEIDDPAQVEEILEFLDGQE
jgi:hypothetical protein